MSHGCVRLAPANAAALFALVQTQGMSRTTVVVSGRTPARGGEEMARRRAPSEQTAAQPQQVATPGYDYQPTPPQAYGQQQHAYAQPQGYYRQIPQRYYGQQQPYYAQQPPPVYALRPPGCTEDNIPAELAFRNSLGRVETARTAVVRAPVPAPRPEAVAIPARPCAAVPRSGRIRRPRQ